MLSTKKAGVAIFIYEKIIFRAKQIIIIETAIS